MAQNPAIQFFRESIDTYETRTSLVEACFQFSFAIHRNFGADSVPGEWGYGASPMGPEAAEDSMLGMDIDTLPLDQLVHGGTVASRLLGLYDMTHGE